MKTLLIVDTFGYFFRNFYALPRLKSRDGRPTGVLLGFANLINQLFNEEFDYLIFALEGGGESVRKQISSDYKANRQETDPELISQIQTAIGWIAKMRLSSVSISGFEADDAIASLSRLAQKQGMKTKIISFDKDLYQLINDDIFIYDPIKKREIREKECFEKFGVEPREFVDYQSLVGDSSDNVSGVKGIGAKTAQKLISEFHSLDNIYANEEALGKMLSPKLFSRILEDKASAYKSKELVLLRDDLVDFFDFQGARKPIENPLFLIENELGDLNINILSKLKKMPKIAQDSDLNANLARDLKDSQNLASSLFEDSQNLAQSAQDSEISFESKKILESEELSKIIDAIPKDAVVAFDTETDSLDTSSARIVGFSFAYNSRESYYVPLRHDYLGAESQVSLDCAKTALQALFSHHIVGHNLKFDLAIIWHNFGLDIENYSDTMILAWLKNSAQPVNMDALALKYLHYHTIKFSDVVQKGETFNCVNIDVATKYAAEDSMITLRLYEFFCKNLDERLLQIARDVEFPFIKTLLVMEKNGIAIDRNALGALREKIEVDLRNISERIFELAGEVFNINSTQQLGEILFSKLGLKRGRALKGKGFSTDEKTLESLKSEHEIIAPLLVYRELSKLLGTYILPILRLSKNNRIYTSFLQTGTTTGRLSSRAPNLQNIPVKTKMGREIRNCFVAKAGYKLISADYSQIELRLLAHFSEDLALVGAFKENKDIHLETATKIFGTSQAAQKRHIAKSINFGLIYGMGARKLAQTLSISQNESKKYIENYFLNFPTVRDFLRKKEEEILNLGYAATLLGRRRNFDFRNLREYETKAFLREGVNAIFQGSAADLIKMAMNECAREFKNRDISMLLQVHDELIFEAKASEADEVAKKIEQIMNNVYCLKVPLVSSVRVAERWGELK